MRFDVEMPEQLQIKVNISRDDGGYKVEAEMPGVKKDDIKVTVDGSLVTISGEVKKDWQEKKGEEVLRSERYFGAVQRSFTLPQEVDEAHVDAKYSDGVLKLMLPLREKSKVKQIAIA
jgi:HSP20 family protein